MSYYDYKNIKIKLESQMYGSACERDEYFEVQYKNMYVANFSDSTSIEEMLKESYESYQMQIKIVQDTAVEFKQAHDEVVKRKLLKIISK